MCAISADDILCFRCMKQVDRCTMDGIVCVCCATCGATARLADAEEDCFVFIVAEAMSATIKDHKPHTYRFMPRTAGRSATEVKAEMVRLNRARPFARAA